MRNIDFYVFKEVNSQLVNVLNRSWPAVSQMVSLTCLPPIVMIFALKSTPARHASGSFLYPMIVELG